MTLLLPIALLLMSAQTPELTQTITLRDEYITATKELIGNLENLARGSRDRLATARERNDTAAVASYQTRLDKTNKDLVEAKSHLAAVPTADELGKEYKKTLARRATETDRECKEWALTQYRRGRGRTITVGFKFVCRY